MKRLNRKVTAAENDVFEKLFNDGYKYYDWVYNGDYSLRIFSTFEQLKKCVQDYITNELQFDYEDEEDQQQIIKELEKCSNVSQLYHVGDDWGFTSLGGDMDWEWNCGTFSSAKNLKQKVMDVDWYIIYDKNGSEINVDKL